jgi:hypothetical protein
LCRAPDGTVAFETIDHAFVEGTGANAKVVTASPPFGGYTTSFGLFDPGGGLGAVAANYVYLMWSYASIAVGLSRAGVVIGKVFATRFDPSGTTVQEDPVPGAVVEVVDEAGSPQGGFAVSQADGRFTITDGRYRGGIVRVKASASGRDHVFADAYEVQRVDWHAYSWGIFGATSLRYYSFIANANPVFAAVRPQRPAPEHERPGGVRDASRHRLHGPQAAGPPGPGALGPDPGDPVSCEGRSPEGPAVRLGLHRGRAVHAGATR